MAGTEMKDGGTVLFAYDGSELDKEAIRWAGRWLQPGPALVLTVWQRIETDPHGPVAMSGHQVERADASLAERAQKIAGEGAAIARRVGFDPTPIAAAQRRSVWSTITAVAELRGSDLIVLGSHGRAGISYVLKGSTATAVSQHAKRPVIVVPEAARPGRATRLSPRADAEAPVDH